MPPTRPEFRGAFFARRYDDSVAFYRDRLGFPRIEAWDRGPNDRGTLFRTGSGIIEVLALPTDPPGDSPWDYRAPQGVTFVVEVSDVDALYARAEAGGVAIAAEPRDYPWGHRAFAVSDPDGIVLYLFSPVGG